MHGHRATEEAVLNSTHYATYHQIFIVDSSPMLALTAVRSYPSATAEGVVAYKVDDVLPYDPLLSVTLNADLEAAVVDATFRFHLGRKMHRHDEPGTMILTNLSPYMVAEGRWVGNRPLFDPGRYIILLTKCVSLLPGSTPAEELPWRPVFIGRIDTADPGSEEGVLIVEARDIFSNLLDGWIEPGPAGGFVMDDLPVEHLIAELLVLGNESIPENEAITGLLYDLGANMQVPSYFQQPESTLLACRRAALLNGWDLRGRWYELQHQIDTGGVVGVSGHFHDLWGIDDFALWYYRPDRALEGPRLRIGPSRYLSLRGFAKSRDEVRNVVEVTPSDPPRTTVKVTDELSIQKYGRRYVGITEDISSGIRTTAQATALALAVLSDLKEPKVLAEIELRYQPFVEINDVLEVEPNDEHHDNPLIVSVSGYTHTLLEGGDARTILRTRDIPAAANKAWRQGRPKLEYVSTEPPSGWAPEGATWRQVESSVETTLAGEV